MTKPPSSLARAGVSASFNALDIAEDVAEHRNVTNGLPEGKVSTFFTGLSSSPAWRGGVEIICPAPDAYPGRQDRW